MSSLTKNTSNRLEWIDIAKGFVILWVVALHIGLLFENNKFVNDLLFHSWAMPFFYIVSGLFINHKEDFRYFLGKKVNQLIVPLVFFVFLTNTLFWMVGDLLGGVKSGWIEREPHWVSTLQFCWYEGHEDFRNFPIWFIPALFNATLSYKCIIALTKDKWALKIICVFTLVGAMLLLQHLSIDLPLFIDVGLLALPYMLIGDLLKNRSGFISEKSLFGSEWKVGVSSLLIFLSCYYVQATWNLFPLIDVLKYVTAISGTMFILWTAKRIQHCSFLAYCGRNSIIILGVHLPLTAIRPFLVRLISNEWLMKGVLFILIVAITCGLCYIFNRFIPKLGGKEPLLNL